MSESLFLNIINAKLADNTYLGDDCAYLEELGLYVTQDTLVEDVHFSLQTTTPKELGWKAGAVNLSDLAASAAQPLYLSVSLSLPSNTNEKFVEDFYEGLDSLCKKYQIKVIGGDLTQAEKIFISICAIGKKISKFNVSRKNATVGDIVITTGNHGESAAGLKLLTENKKEPSNVIKKHLLPLPQIEKGLNIGKIATRNYAMMDTSDGLGDALYKIAKESNVSIEVKFEKIPYNTKIKELFPDQYKDLILWGGEDFELVATIPEDVYEKLDKNKFFKIGQVKSGKNVIVDEKNSTTIIDKNEFEKNSYQHFEESK